MEKEQFLKRIFGWCGKNLTFTLTLLLVKVPFDITFWAISLGVLNRHYNSSVGIFWTFYFWFGIISPLVMLTIDLLIFLIVKHKNKRKKDR